MTDIGLLCAELYERIDWQRMPPSMTQGQIEEMLVRAIVDAIEDLFVVTGRAAAYEQYSYQVDEETGRISEFDYTLLLDEKLYVLCRAQMTIFSKVRTQYTDILGYTTNALTVTNADKPYAYLTGTIDELRRQLELYYYKMVRYSHL